MQRPVAHVTAEHVMRMWVKQHVLTSYDARLRVTYTQVKVDDLRRVYLQCACNGPQKRRVVLCLLLKAPQTSSEGQCSVLAEPQSEGGSDQGIVQST